MLIKLTIHNIKMVKVLGIDEAGRGPVIGPMIMAGAMIEEGNEGQLGSVKDSKLVSQKDRIILERHLKKQITYEVLVVEPEIIDAAVLSGELNLNWLEAHKQAEIINKLKPDKAIIDCPSINCEAYEKYLMNLIDDKSVKLVVEHKADEKYPICSAASILAKTEREKQMGDIKRKYGNTGSGYPADPNTKEFIKSNWNKCPEIFRKSWSTYKKFADKEKQKGIADY
jgi:ribonuclease HII